MNDLNETLIVRNADNACDESTAICDYGFKYLSVNDHTLWGCECSEKNSILFLIKGSIVLNTNFCYKKTIEEGELVLLPQASSIRLEANPKSQMILLSFNSLADVCDSTLLQQLNKKVITQTDVHTLKIQPSLMLFADTLIYCLSKKTMCFHWHKTMSQDFFLLLNEFYSEEKIVEFLAPSAGNEFRFEKFILQNYTQVHSINELIVMSQYSRSMFYAKFKEVFGMTAKQWVLRQTATRILEMASKPGASVKGLLDVCDFDSPSQLNRYVKQTFNCTPKELIEQNQKS